MIMENLRYMLYQFHYQTALHIGSRFAVDWPNTQEGFMTGAGNVFSRKALVKFNQVKNDFLLCPQGDSTLDDVFVGEYNNLAHFNNFIQIDFNSRHVPKISCYFARWT